MESDGSDCGNSCIRIYIASVPFTGENLSIRVIFKIKTHHMIIMSLSEQFLKVNIAPI